MVTALKSAVTGSDPKNHVSPFLLEKVHQFTTMGETKET